MKKYILPIVIFVVFIGLDLGVIALIEANEIRFALAAIFLEIAIFGCIMIYDICKRNEKKSDKKEELKGEPKDEQINIDSDKK